MVGLAGIGSGIDFQSLIDGFVAAERIPISTIEVKKGLASITSTRLGTLATRLTELETAAKELDEMNKVRAMVATSSNESGIEVLASDVASPGSYALTVNSLAQAQVNTSAGFATDATGVAGAGTLDITVGADAAVQITYDATMNLTDIADQINLSEARVTASVINDGTEYRLLINADDRGAANAVSFTETGGPLGLQGSTPLVDATDASFDLSGLAITRPSNNVADLFPGVTFELKQVTDPADGPIEIEVSNDPELLREKVTAFTDAYNEVSKLITTELSSGSTGVSVGPLAGDPTLQRLQRSLSGMVSSVYTNGATTTSLGQIGINIQNDGTLSIDDAAFETALANDPDALGNLLAGDGATSLTANLKGLVTEYTETGTGILEARKSSLKTRIDDYDDQIDRINRRADNLQERLQRQYAALDGLLANMNTQLGFLSQAFLPINNNNR